MRKHHRFAKVFPLIKLQLTGVRLHPPGRTDKNFCRCFGAPARRVFPDHLITPSLRVASISPLCGFARWCCDGGGARLRGGSVRNRGRQRDHQGGAAARPPHRPTPAFSRRPLTSRAGGRDRAHAVHVPAHQSAAVDQQRAASPNHDATACQQFLPHAQFLQGQPLRRQPSVPARPSPGALLRAAAAAT